MKLHRSWKQFFAGAVLTIALFIIGFSLYNQETEEETPIPEVYLTLAEEDFTNVTTVRYWGSVPPFTIQHIEPSFLPKEVEIRMSFPLNDVQLQQFKNQTIFMFTVQNLGQGIATNVVALIDMDPPNLVTNIEIGQPERVKIIEGGINGSRVKFSVDTLTPGEVQGATIYTEDNRVREFSGWSEEEGDLSNVFYFRLIFHE